MSYILDALRRAEADRERERGQVPGLHTPPPSGHEVEPATGPRRWLPWAGGGLLLLAGIGAGSWWASGPQEAISQLPSPAPSATAPLSAPVVPPTAQARPPAVSVPAPLAAASGSPYLAPEPPPGAAAVAAAPGPVVAAPPTENPAAAPAEARIPRLAELPESTLRELPRLVISGSVYSDDPASRFVMINGEVQREGAKLGADLVLEQIRPRELVLRFKGQRYRQPV
ncbi:general secretion pathway protein GspB [Roseateles sp.]|uniref:general secretion pathway protein GspB n=1 Tax=Roseateles sp. TaxID=1971397 RepID=UPI0039E7F160